MIKKMIFNKNDYLMLPKKVKVPKGTSTSTIFTDFPNTSCFLLNADLELDVCASSNTAYLVGRSIDLPIIYEGESSTTYGPVWVRKSDCTEILGGVISPLIHLYQVLRAATRKAVAVC
ncbi:hypothetical protein [Lactobacillus crispatus]|uniref:hypothetical protein n=1 Tax=Lactobacillus crispatus TaxID=47770 RepID=UPI000E07858B|nr:hypothetical protein [Lactobacillus crispatus]STX17720.1 Uncharacterised protein [Lactobacillus acidophilus]MDX5112325.1 hypothetical protein [Lactobacillus crispatus]MDX5119448.1 hypothetical protein [Lactobacillus crispatus]MDX5125299.1 hypothetical protein [Lactobacillus crispatus]MDX5134313.1 hypothetical protein [Lactobacillus crispatus]